MADNKYHTIVVGGGIAGLTSAAYVARQGHRVLIIEKNAECGGLTNSFTRNGFRFEAGIRALENAGIILPMLKELGIQMEFVKSHVSVGLENEILHIEDISSLTGYRNLLVRFYPDSESEIDHLMRVIRKVMKNMDVLYGLENPNFKDMFGDREYLFNELLPWLPKFLLTIGKINRMNMPVESYLRTIISNPSLLDIVAQHFFKNTPTFFALSYFSLYLDYFYPKGGVGKLSEALKDKTKNLAALVFLDPFGMQINWESIESLKGTRSDVWILIPTGVIVNRLLDSKCQLKHSIKLQSFFGLPEQEIKDFFYTTKTYNGLFGDVEIIQKISNPIEKIAELYVEKLKTIWSHVTEKPLRLYNSKRVPIFHLVFASNNSTGLKIAKDIIKNV